ncbi:YfiR family protein [Acinetobacter gerneri]|uniref:YfiR family protein n=1 Tax=Acinetobacter gerneri TaxID=202952 RepID=UPI003C6C3C75
MVHIFLKKLYRFLWVLPLVYSSNLFAYTSHNIYTTTLSILSYVKWNTTTPNLCVVDTAAVANQFQQVSKQLKYPYVISSIKLESFTSNNCSAIFFSHTPIATQQQFLNRYSILSFSMNNKDCELGSAFCLVSKLNGDTSFKINLDALTRARVHVDPRVLLLAKNVENDE